MDSDLSEGGPMPGDSSGKSSWPGTPERDRSGKFTSFFVPAASGEKEAEMERKASQESHYRREASQAWTADVLREALRQERQHSHDLQREFLQQHLKLQSELQGQL